MDKIELEDNISYATVYDNKVEQGQLILLEGILYFVPSIILTEITKNLDTLTQVDLHSLSEFNCSISRTNEGYILYKEYSSVNPVELNIITSFNESFNSKDTFHIRLETTNESLTNLTKSIYENIKLKLNKSTSK